MTGELLHKHLEQIQATDDLEKSLLMYPTKAMHQSFGWIALCDQRLSSWH